MEEKTEMKCLVCGAPLGHIHRIPCYRPSHADPLLNLAGVVVEFDCSGESTTTKADPCLGCSVPGDRPHTTKCPDEPTMPCIEPPETCPVCGCFMTAKHDEMCYCRANIAREAFRRYTDMEGNPLDKDWAKKQESLNDHLGINADPWAHRSSGMKCHTCMWFVLKTLTCEDQPDGSRSRRKFGRCRRRCPTMSGYPAVFGDDWCGDHKLDEGKV